MIYPQNPNTHKSYTFWVFVTAPDSKTLMSTMMILHVGCPSIIIGYTDLITELEKTITIGTSRFGVYTFKNPLAAPLYC